MYWLGFFILNERVGRNGAQAACGGRLEKHSGLGQPRNFEICGQPQFWAAHRVK
jgi:hypothetical protein